MELDAVMVKNRCFVMVAGLKGVRRASWRRKGRICDFEQDLYVCIERTQLLYCKMESCGSFVRLGDEAEASADWFIDLVNQTPPIITSVPFQYNRTGIFSNAIYPLPSLGL